MSLREVTATVPPAAPPEPARVADAATPPAAGPAPEDVVEDAAVEAGSSVAAAVECARLYREAQDVDVVALAEGCVPASGPAVPDHAIAAVLALRGLAHRRQGSPERAAEMLGLAVERLPAETEMAPAALGPVAALAGRELSAGADASAAGPGVLVELRLATALLRVASGLAPSDTDLSSRLRQSREAQWLAYEQCASTLLGRRDFAGAHRVIQEALGAGVLPPARESSFRDLLWTSVTGEIGRLTGQALNPEVEVEEQVARLAEAEGIIRDLPEDALTESKGEDLVRRVWWGYMKLGTQRVEARDLDGALEPLYRALRLGEVDADRQQETRRLLLETLDGIVDRWSAGIRRLAADGNQAGARREAKQLAELIDDAGRRGLAGDDLAAVTSRRDEIQALVGDPH
jgi:hypothetical protein